MMKMEIISRETIKPSSPTPSHLHSYNLSEQDLLIENFYIPMVVFYPKNNDDTTEQKSILLKKSLSHTLTQYYPFAGRLPTPNSPYIDCNDKGLLFLEVRSDCQLDTFQHMIDSSGKGILSKLFADDLVVYNNPSSTNPIAVQLTHFACGGLSLAVSLAHGIGDFCTLSSFLSHWASVARYGSADHKAVLPKNPHFIQFPRSQPRDAKIWNTLGFSNKTASRKFIFPNSRLNELKNKVVVEAINNPTRFEVLTSLLYKTAVAASTAKYGCFKPSYLMFAMNIRHKFVPKVPQSTFGNLVLDMMIETTHASQTSISMLIEEIRKKKKLLEGIRSVEELIEASKAYHAKLRNEDLENFAKGSYTFGSLCGFPFNKLDFGWGNPVATTEAFKGADTNNIIMMDTIDGDGIEVMVFLEKECMEIFESDKEMLSYCKI